VKLALLPDRSRLGLCKRPTSTSTAPIPSMISAVACFSAATCTHCSTDGSSPSIPAPGQSRSHQSSSAIQGSTNWTAGLSSCPRTCGHGSNTYKSMRRSLARPGDNWLDKDSADFTAPLAFMVEISSIQEHRDLSKEVWRMPRFFAALAELYQQGAAIETIPLHLVK
jgi:hypothetical protein